MRKIVNSPGNNLRTVANNKLLRELARGYTTCGRNVPLLKFLFVNFFGATRRFASPLNFRFTKRGRLSRLLQNLSQFALPARHSIISAATSEEGWLSPV